MKRSLLLSILAIAIVAMSLGQAMAAVTVSLNLRYNDPADASEGGTWDLLAKTDTAFGLAGITAVIDNINLAGITLNTGIGAIPLESKITGTVVEFVYGQNLNAGTVLNVGRGAGTPGNVAQDDLFGTSGTTYDNMAKIASGTFGALRPVMQTSVATGFAGNEYTNAAMTTVTANPGSAFTYGGTDGVRGDSVAVDGLKPGDANRDGVVNLSDFTILGSPTNYNQANKGWDGGDFNDDGLTNLSDFTILGSPSNYNQTAPNPALAAVPEPTSMLMLGMGILSLAGLRRRS